MLVTNAVYLRTYLKWLHVSGIKNRGMSIKNISENRSNKNDFNNSTGESDSNSVHNRIIDLRVCLPHAIHWLPTGTL